jgi:hypothetical protein
VREKFAVPSSWDNSFEFSVDGVYPPTLRLFHLFVNGRFFGSLSSYGEVDSNLINSVILSELGLLHS